MRSIALPILMLLASAAVAPDARGEGFEAIAPLVGKTWVGEDVSAKGERTVSVEKWEWILGGKAVLVTQSVNNGELGMQYTYFIDPITHGLSFHAVSTLGPTSEGTLGMKDGKLIRDERIIGDSGINEVKNIYEILSDDSMMTSSEYYRDSKQLPGGHDFHYHVDRGAKINFSPAGK